MLLALDTSSTWLGLALCGPGGLLAVGSAEAGMRQTVQCVAEIDRLLARSGVAPSALDGVAVALGPGGFTSLRLGLSVAKGLCLALGRPILGIDSLAAMVHPCRALGQGRALGALLDLGRGEIAAQWYSEPELRPVGDLVTGDATQVAASAPSGDLLLVAEVAGGVRDGLAATFGARAIFLDVPAPLLRVTGVAALGWARLLGGQMDDLVALEPHYPRRSGQPTHLSR